MNYHHTMLCVTLPTVFIALPLDMALTEARANLEAHRDNFGEDNPYTIADIARLEAIEARLFEAPGAGVTLDAEDIATIAGHADEWMSGLNLDRLTVDDIKA